VDVRVGADVLDRVRWAAPEARREGRPTVGPGAVVRDDPRVRHIAQAIGVELADEPGAQHPDTHLGRTGHQYPPSVEPDAVTAGAAPALRARKSSMIVFVAVAPIRVVPRAMTSSRASRVRTPPAALTWMCGDVLARMRRRSSCVAPPGANPVEVLTKSAPAASVRWHARIFSSSVRQAFSKITLTMAPAA